MKQTFSFYGLPGLNAALKKHQFSWKSVLFMALAGAVTLFVTLAHPPAHAYDVLIQPAGPRQGDTVAIITTEKAGTASVPTLKINDVGYPTFAVGQGRYRTFLPTSPLHPSGEYIIKVEGPEGPRNPMVWLSDRSFRTQYITLSPSQRIWAPITNLTESMLLSKSSVRKSFGMGRFYAPARGASALNMACAATITGFLLTTTTTGGSTMLPPPARRLLRRQQVE